MQHNYEVYSWKRHFNKQLTGIERKDMYLLKDKLFE